MKRAALYSSASRPRKKAAPPALPGPLRTEPPRAAAPEMLAPPKPATAARLAGFARRHDKALVFVAGLALAGLAFLVREALRPPAPPALEQEAVDSAVLRTLKTHSLPAKVAEAAESVRQSVVRVQSMPDGAANARAKGVETGSGVVIVDDGTILTALHVVRGADRIVVTFYDGSESEAVLLGARPDHDLAVIRATKIPDDLPPATLGSSARLRPGDGVVAVGFPFGLGPSVSAGVVSGLDREFRSEDGHALLKGLIQFDAAVNPGSSGGPLVTLDGEVVGVVSAILNPASRTFLGIGFATTMETAGSAVGMPPF